MESQNELTRFGAKFKTIIARGGELATLDFIAEPDQGAAVAQLLKVLDAAFELEVDGQVFLPVKVGYLKFNGDGKVYVRLIADTKDQIQYLQTRVDREVNLRAVTK